mmetsp:Transcript_40369/g.48938  ORF Transcript_40369/g.48938 Transcript_40369/m.48938 type:complete len:267 (+) Transcript_40369:138-938(+)|eukprot:CAMPEP_0197857230 /NCGR_PEP_ID=MMETSP1438-20131217/30095_1 /TAXON_ID=1461541 /ORGANISM="Pterosperma sp., Strain CCMP1384" /LENGTH=266 /DNA_ID=CAMNT_0043472985 /DNA_START=137 /DNA_END=937 /DNA_ORIENTATION=-
MALLKNLIPAARRAPELLRPAVAAARTATPTLFHNSTPGTQDNSGRRSFHSTRSLSAGKVFAACVIERYPLIAPEPEQWDVEYQEWSRQRKLDMGFWMELPDELIQTTKTEESPEEAAWEPAPRVTHADLSGDKRSLYRALDKKLYLVFKTADGDWHFPHAELEEGETARQLAERAITNYWNDEKKQLYFIGNAPAAHFQIPEGQSIEGAEAGDTLFYFRASFQGETFKFEKHRNCADYQWVTNDEIAQYFKGKEQQELLETFLRY